MIGYYVYQTYMKVPLGQLREQIETNKKLVESHLLEPYTSWSILFCHTPKKEKQYTYTCKDGCCRFEV
jgi:hypothetical protein